MKRADITALFPDATKEQIDQILNLNGADITSAKLERDALQTQLTAAQARIAELEANDKSAELQTAQERVQTLQTELDDLKSANSLREMRASVAKDTGVPAELITADTEEAARAQAQGILDFAKPAGYPAVKDGGDPTPGAASGTDSAWLSFASRVGESIS